MSSNQLVTARTAINENGFIEIFQGRYGIDLKIVTEKNRISIPVTIEVLDAIRAAIDLLSLTTSVETRKERKRRS